jgi:hypothetical protein
MCLPTIAALGSGLVWRQFGDNLSKNSGFLNREKHSVEVQRHPGRGSLLRLEKQRLLTEGSAPTVDPLGRQDERQDGSRWG